MGKWNNWLNAITFSDDEKDVEVIVYNNTKNVPFYKWEVPDEIHIRLIHNNDYIGTFTTYYDGSIQRFESIAMCAITFASAASENDRVIALMSKHIDGIDLTYDETIWLKVEYGLEVCPHERITNRTV